MATYNRHNQFIADVFNKVHNMGSDAITVYLTAAANPPTAGNSVIADITQISYTNLSTRVVTISASSQTLGTYKLVATDKVLTASGDVATFRYVGLYNDTPASPLDPLICWWDYGDNVTLHNGDTFTLDFDDANGVLQVAPV